MPKPAGVTSGRDGAKITRNEKFAMSWAKARADNTDMFSRNTPDNVSGTGSKHKDVGFPKIHKEETKRGVRQNSRASTQTRETPLLSAPNSGVSSRRGGSDSDRVLFTNTWAQVQRRRKALQKTAAKCGIRSAQKTDTLLENQPVVNDVKEVTKLYTAMTVGIRPYPRTGGGRGVLNGSQSNPETLNSHNKTSEYILSRREADTYRRITKVYDGNTEAVKRQSRFYQQLEDVQEKVLKQKIIENSKKKRENEEAKKRHKRQLRDVRERYMADKMSRFSHQHISRKIIEAEESDREIYGLPNEYSETENKKTSKKHTNKSRPSNPEDRTKRNMKKFGFLFAIQFRQNLQSTVRQRPKMEGIDTVVIAEKTKGNVTKERKYSVQDILLDAKRCLREPTPTVSGNPSGRLSVISVDLDEEDLFEKARKKYGVEMNSDDDDDGDVNDRKYL
ncbi:uncharacterized protein LOC135467366 [Liolophura sinensis]|uniref:uncharacterized protein LOC135467366 n=1 Tax=Liolophura sinensis TaxID=3198878 RepID=UPI0031592E9C